jgi:hypothetical protein
MEVVYLSFVYFNSYKDEENNKIGKIISASTHPPIKIHDDDAEEETGNS